MNTRFSDHEFSLNTLITIFFAYFDISTELATDSFFRMHGDRNNFYLIAFIFSEYQQKVRKIKYNQPDFFIKGYDPFHYSTLSPRNNHIFHEQKRYKWSDTIYTRYQLYFSLFSCWQNLSNCFHAIWSKRKTLYKTEPLAFSFESLHSLAINRL